jgi:endonuclease/exonuclease/phosphatase family metal-dependent hydrolase
MIKILFFLLLSSLLFGDNVRIASYNVENLFDLKYDHREYVEYIPNTSWKWNKKNQNIKLKNISKVISDINPDIIGLQEIESTDALLALKKKLQKNGNYYRYYAFANAKNTTVKVGLLSKYPIMYSKELWVRSSRKYRNILEVKLNINGKELYIFINHWKAKSGAENQRIISAKVLKKRIYKLGHNKPILIMGDLNSHYEEYKIFKKKRKHNNTNGKTGINNTLKTLHKNRPVSMKNLLTCKDCLYNLWYDSKIDERWTHSFRGSKEALDNMIISKGLADKRGIDYLKGSFKRFSPKYLLYYKKPYRWQRSRNYPKHHIGKGYSDHFPIYADFKVINTN